MSQPTDEAARAAAMEILDASKGAVYSPIIILGRALLERDATIASAQAQVERIVEHLVHVGMPPRHHRAPVEQQIQAFAVAERAAREKAERALALIRSRMKRRDEGYSDNFERLAEEFYRETGLMAPGKSQPIEMAHHDNDTERSVRWDEWIKKRNDEIYDAIDEALAPRETPEGQP